MADLTTYRLVSHYKLAYSLSVTGVAMQINALWTAHQPSACGVSRRNEIDGASKAPRECSPLSAKERGAINFESEFVAETHRKTARPRLSD